ncbi:MAG: hypothetical protein H0X33_14105 [Taibaiella sp.]|nr:hypothetical protein [Taibaiella sp.]
MSIFEGDYLRVLTPETTDGVTPRMENDKLVLREDHLPLDALKYLEKENDRLPAILKHRIERVRTGPTYTPPQGKIRIK